MTTVYLVDDEAPVRDALAFLLGSRGLDVRTFESGPALLDALPQPGSASASASASASSSGHAPKRAVRGVFVLDVRMPQMSGLQLHEALIERGLRNPVLFLSGHGDIPMVVEALKKGAFDFLEKPYSDNTLVDRIAQALAVEAASVADNAAAVERQARLASLSEREREVMQRVAAGKLNKVIADELHIAIRTVEVHRARVFAKVGVKSAAELAGWLAAG